MKILETHNMPIKDAVTFARKRDIRIGYTQLVGILQKTPVRNNTFIIPGTYPANTTYLRFQKAKRGCVVEVCQVSF